MHRMTSHDMTRVWSGKGRFRQGRASILHALLGTTQCGGDAGQMQPAGPCAILESFGRSIWGLFPSFQTSPPPSCATSATSGWWCHLKRSFRPLHCGPSFTSLDCVVSSLVLSPGFAWCCTTPPPPLHVFGWPSIVLLSPTHSQSCHLPRAHLSPVKRCSRILLPTHASR